MRQETISDNLIVTWRDERQGRAQLADLAQLPAIFTHFNLEQVEPSLPLTVENDDFVLTYPATSTPPYSVLISRKPHGPLQTAAWQYAEETRMAKIEFQDGELGMHFLDENQFAPFSRLQFDSKTGFTIT